MTGVIVNTITVLIGSLIGMLFRKGIPEKITKASMVAIGLCSICIGIGGMIQGKDTLVLIIAMVLGTMLGTAIDIDGRLNSLSDKAAKSFRGNHTNPAEGFVTASLVFCVGSMTILGGLEAGLEGDNTLYYTKAVLDLISSVMLTTTLGIGVMFSAVSVLVYQGALVIAAGILAPYLTTEIIAELNCAGSLMIFALGLNLSGVGKFKVANFLPAIVLVPVIVLVKGLF